jgi:hypothetical protein
MVFFRLLQGQMHLVRVLPSFLRGALTFAPVAENIAFGFSGFLRAVAERKLPGGSRSPARRRAEKNEMAGVKCPRRINGILPGRPQGVATSRGTQARYQRNQAICKQAPGHGSAAGMADLPSQGVWAAVSCPAVEPVVLPRSRVPAMGASLARRAAATRPAGGVRGAGEPCGGRAHAAAAKCRPEQALGRGRFGVGNRGWVWRVVTQRNPTSACVVRPAGLLRTSAGFTANDGILWQRCLSRGHASGAGPKAQILGSQDESWPAQASPGVRGRGQEATGVTESEPRCSTVRSDRGWRRGRSNRGRRLWAGRAVLSTFPAIPGGCRA